MDATGTGFDVQEGRPEGGPFPVAGRVAAVIVGALLAVWFSLVAATFHAQGLVLTGIALPAVTFPFALLLVLVGLVPGVMQRTLGRVTAKLDLRDGGHVFALIVVTLALFIIFGLGSIVEGVHGYETVVLERGDAPGGFPDVTEAVILQGLLVNLVLFGAPALVWLTFVNDHSLGGAFHALGLKSEGAPAALGIGALAAVASILGVGVLVALVTAAGVPVPENEQALEVAEGVSVGGAFAVAALSGLGEEVFFRGFVYPRVGMIPQAVLFAIAHLSYVNVLQVVVTFALALVFAWLYKRTGNLWAPVAAHFTFNLIMLLLPRLAGYAEGF